VNVNIRKAKEEDLKSVVEMFKVEYSKEPYNERWSVERALEKVKNYFKDDVIFVAEIEGKIIGFIIVRDYLWDDSRRGSVEEFVVLADFQGKGVGTKLMGYIEKYFLSKGIRHLSFFTSKKARAAKFYEKLGFKETDFVNFEKELK